MVPAISNSEAAQGGPNVIGETVQHTSNSGPAPGTTLESKVQPDDHNKGLDLAKEHGNSEELGEELDGFNATSEQDGNDGVNEYCDLDWVDETNPDPMKPGDDRSLSNDYDSPKIGLQHTCPSMVIALS